MIWLNPIALVALAAIASPILIHILVQRRAERMLFPTLRFLQPTRLAAVRRHVLDDLPLLVVRAAILAAAAGALASPLLVTPGRRAAWNARTARAIVAESAVTLDTLPAAFRTETFETADLGDGIARAIRWLGTAPPARRELVVVSPFALGSLSHADLTDAPANVGIRLVRMGDLPQMREFPATAVLQADSEGTVRQRDRTIVLTGPSTAVRESAGSPATAPIEMVATPGVKDVKQAAEAVLAAVLSQAVFAPAPGRAARVVFGPSGTTPATLPAAPMPPWIAEAISRITSDPELQAVDGVPVFSASTDGTRLSVTTALPAADIRTALLFRSILNALAPASAAHEVLTIPDAELRASERPSGEVGSPRAGAIDLDDRRWWWAAVLALLALEAWMRRGTPARLPRWGPRRARVEHEQTDASEVARVA